MKILCIWLAYQAKQEYILCSLIQTQILFNNTDLKQQLQQPILILAQMTLFIFNFKQVVLDYEQIIIIIVQLVIFSLWLYRERSLRPKDSVEARQRKNQHQCTIDIQVDTLKQQQNLIHTISTKRINLPQNSLLFNDQCELLETQINFTDLITHPNQYNQAFEILLNLKFNYIEDTALKQRELRIIVLEMQIDEQHLLTIDKNEYMKYENQAMLIQCMVVDGIKCFQLQFFALPLKMNDSQEIEESMEIDMCRSLSHELGTNLNSIITFIKMALKDEDISCHFKSKYLEPIRINSEQLNLIVGTIRDYNLINLRQFSLRLEEVDIELEIRFIVSLFNESIENKNIKIQYSFDLQSSVLVNDKVRFRQVLFQLLQNAIKYTFESAITITIQNDNLECFISISDDGIGMEAENMNSLLNSNKFVKVSEQSVGVGLGLGISNQLVKQMSGKNNSIKLNRKDRGCQFSFFIKNHQLEMSKESMRKQSSGFVKKSSQTIRFISANTYFEDQVIGESIQKIQIQKTLIQTHSNSQQQFILPSTKRIYGQQESKNQSEEDSFSSIHPPILSPKFQQSIVQCSLNSDCCSRVLIVDDEYFNIQCLKLLMTKYQSKCDSAYNGKEALQLVYQKKQHPCKKCGNQYYSLIFLDINMPILDGYKTVKELKHLMKQQIINKAWCIANTGFCDLDTKLKSYEAGMDYYLTKPLDQNELRNMLNVLFPINDY
ncbi:unnamed protein product (macronuclear) [Paramecium tetraurelia]|uniref:Response regulatory domain-containing protein n=1 Tax=Paramecium tetraurelia TaxID=5888 RepID=A0CC59_PARTE|nr:uncharacterized protein GSPATT00037160001 [Paramecium tetraurelia]CAK68376.1 unnamed protein product [Paramecium tetraurelia]|eukprot:XP_001435773.1 hypothetical protein (macronuclear) [Paramecium tetraurelia strain d4-2]